MAGPDDSTSCKGAVNGAVLVIVTAVITALGPIFNAVIMAHNRPASTRPSAVAPESDRLWPRRHHGPPYGRAHRWMHRHDLCPAERRP